MAGTVSAGRRYRRMAAKGLTPPPQVLAAAEMQQCPDCDSSVSVKHDGKSWRIGIHHDDECVQLAFRQKHGATRALMLVPLEPGGTIPGELVTEVVSALDADADAVRVAANGNAAFGQTERRAWLNGNES